MSAPDNADFDCQAGMVRGKDFPKCANCHFARSNKGQSGRHVIYDCHRYPPSQMLGGLAAVVGTDWCGEFKARGAL